MRARTNYPERRRLSLSAEGFRGLDLSAVSTLSSPKWSSLTFNLACRDGVLRRRPAWRQCADKLRDRINGIFGVRYRDGDTLLVYAGKGFYLLVNGLWREMPVYNGTGLGLPAGLSDAPLTGVQMGEYLYLVGAGAYLVYGCFDGVWEVRVVDPYIPTTTVGISPLSVGDEVRETNEAVNLLTPWRKNTLFGGAAGSSWVLDGAVSNAFPIEIRATVVREGQVVERVLVNRPSEGGTRIYDESGAAAGSLDPASGRLTLAEALDGEGSLPNVTVTFAAAKGIFGGGSDTGRQTVYGARTATLFGVGGESDRIFLCGGGERANWLLFSEVGNPAYFPDENVLRIGGGGEITALFRLADASLAVSHRNGVRKELLRVTGVYRSIYGEDGSLLRRLHEFSVRAAAIGTCAAGLRAVASPAGEALMLTEHGVLAIEEAQGLVNETHRLTPRARTVDGLLRGKKLTDSVMATDGETIYLFVGEMALVCRADSLSRTQDGGVGYDWFRWTAPPVTCVTHVGEQMLFGTAEGQIATLDGEGWYDESYDTTVEGELGLDYGTGEVVFGASLDGMISVGERLCFSTDGVYARMLLGIERVEGTRIYARQDHDLPLWSWEVYADGTEGTTLAGGRAYFIVDPDPASRSFSLAESRDGSAIDLSGASTALSLYVRLSERECYVSEVDTARRRLRLSLGKGGRGLKISPFVPVGAEPPLDPIARILYRVQIKACWRTPPTDLGDASHEKVLDGVYLTGTGWMCVHTVGETQAQKSTVACGEEMSEVDLGRVDFVGGMRTVRLYPRIRSFERMHLEIFTDDPDTRIYGFSIEAHAKHYRNGEVQ